MGAEARRQGDWFLSFKGRQLWPCDLRPSDIDIEEVAHGLAHICRFGGQCETFYSVAQHSVLVQRQLPAELQPTGLLHDATEAYLGDVIRPLKRHHSMQQYVALEGAAWAAMAQRFNLPSSIPMEVKLADTRMLLTERRDLLPEHPWSWKEDEKAVQPYSFRIRPWSPLQARREFMATARRIL